MRSSFLILPLLFAIAGCGHDGPEKAIVRGVVTYRGTPVANGEILFYPIDGTIGPVSGAPIKEGAYSAEAKGGVPVGRHRVVISGYRPLPGAAGSLDSAYPLDDGKRANEQYLPAKFNMESTLTRIVESGEAEQIADFKLED